MIGLSKDADESRAKNFKRTACVRTAVENKTRALKSSAKKLSSKAQQLGLSTVSGVDRWWNKLEGDADFIMKWLPPAPAHCRVHLDQLAGRFFVHYNDRDRVSVAWTKRGLRDAQMEALRVLWHYHELETGEQCPIPLA